MTELNKTARSIAVEVLYDVDVNGAYANLALDKSLFACHLNQKDRALATELVYGTVKYRDHLDHIINQFSAKHVHKMDAWTRQIIRLSVYQLFFLDRIPERAIVHEAVQLAKAFKKKNSQADRFTNGVLRGIIRGREEIVWPNKKKNKALYLAKKYSFPQWMIEHWLRDFGLEQTEALCQWFNAPAPLWVRTNTLRQSRAILQEELKRAGIESEQDVNVPEALLLKDSGGMRQIDAFKEGRMLVQDISSMLAAHAVAPQAGERILDCCAAPGGKTTHLAQLMQNTGQIIANDLHAHRVHLIEENATRLDIDIIETMTGDARALPDHIKAPFDRILIDVPCSGLGVLNRRADARWQKRRQDLSELVFLQREILEAVSSLLKPGGVLVYSSCTLNRAENEEQIAWFLDQHKDFQRDPLPKCFDRYEKNAANELLILPFRDQMDGFFISRLKKEAYHD